MNKRHYEHTLPNIRGSLSNTYKEINATHFFIAFSFKILLFLSIIITFYKS